MENKPYFGLAVEDKQMDDIFVLKLSGRLDSLTVPENEKSICDKISQKSEKVILDLSELTYMSTSGLRLLLLISTKIQEAEGKLVLACLTSNVKSMMNFSGTDTLFDITDTLDEALKSF